MRDAEQIAEHLYRISECRRWIQTNVLFPEVSDNLVNPARDALCQIENALVALLYRQGEVWRAVEIEKQLRPAPRTPVA